MAQSFPATQSQLSPSGQVCGLSGVSIGTPIFMGNANGFDNLYVMGQAVLSSGPLLLQVQCSDTDTSGTYTDPTSGLAQLPTYFSSGGILIINSGSTGGILNGLASGQAVLSGFAQGAAFQRPQTFVRVNMLSGFFIGNVQAGLISQLRTTGSGGGTTQAPGSGTVSV